MFATSPLCLESRFLVPWSEKNSCRPSGSLAWFCSWSLCGENLRAPNCKPKQTRSLRIFILQQNESGKPDVPFLFFEQEIKFHFATLLCFQHCEEAWWNFLRGDFSSHHSSPWHTDWTFGCRWFPFVEICRESSQDRNRYLKQSMLYTQPCNDTNYSGRMFNIYTLENKHGTQKWRFGICFSFSTGGFLGSTEISSPLGGRWSNFSSHHHLHQLHVRRSYPGGALNSSGSSWW